MWTQLLTVETISGHSLAANSSSARRTEWLITQQEWLITQQDRTKCDNTRCSKIVTTWNNHFTATTKKPVLLCCNQVLLQEFWLFLKAVENLWQQARNTLLKISWQTHIDFQCTWEYKQLNIHIAWSPVILCSTLVNNGTICKLLVMSNNYEDR